MTVILGAGCAGLSLARGLVEAGDEEPITLVDRREGYGNDRTWCFWQADPPPRWAGPAHHAWHRWRMIGRDGTIAEHASQDHPYVQVRADDFYEASLRALGAAPNVTLRLGTRVIGVSEPEAAAEAAAPAAAALPSATHPAYRAATLPADRPQLAVETSAGTFWSHRVFDAMGGHGPFDRGAPAGSIELRQSFLGLEIETARPAFDPAVATIMDFRCGPTSDGLHFMYVLPTTPTRALVEHTTLGPTTVPAATRREAIAAYLSAHWSIEPGVYDVAREERGVLPMSTRTFPLERRPGLRTVGAAAGAIRPSSGYAFVRIQRHARALAEATLAGAPPPPVGSPRHAVLDQLFLRALAVDPRGFDRTLLALARGTSADVFARFMSDASTVRDEALVMRSLVRPGFLVGMAASSLLRPLAR